MAGRASAGLNEQNFGPLLPARLPAHPPSTCLLSHRSAHDKFSVFWGLPRAAVAGVLNGMEDEEGLRPAAPPTTDAELDELLARKSAAKLAFQAGRGLQVGSAACSSRLGLHRNCPEACAARLTTLLSPPSLSLSRWASSSS